MAKDYYKILEVNKDASEQEIKTNYKKLAVKWHPDKNPNNKEEATQKFNDISEAYNVLKDPTKRKAYDNFGVAGVDDNMQMPGFNFDPFSMFRDFFQRENSVPDVQIPIKLTLEEIFLGTKKKVKYDRFTLCKNCKGKGAIGDTVDCNKCNGKGVNIARTQMGMIQSQCMYCFGKGIDPSAKKCDTCRGNTCIKEEHNINVTFPKGISEKFPVIIENEGNEIPENERSNNNVRSNVVVIVEEISHQKYKRGTIIPEVGKLNENNLLIEVKLTLEEALCGFEKTFTHLDGKLFKFSMTDVVKNGNIYVMKNLGMPVYNKSNFGDLLIKISVEHKNLSSDQKAKIWKTLSDNPYHEIKKASPVSNFSEYKHDVLNEQKRENIKNKYRRRQNNDDLDDDFSPPGMGGIPGMGGMHGVNINQCAQQ